MNKISKIMWVMLYLVGLTSCMSKSGQRRAVVQSEKVESVKPAQDSITYFVRYKNSIYPLAITSAEYQVMNRLGMDSVTIEKEHLKKHFELSTWEGTDYYGTDYLFVTIPFTNIVGQSITPINK